MSVTYKGTVANWTKAANKEIKKTDEMETGSVERPTLCMKINLASTFYWVMRVLSQTCDKHGIFATLKATVWHTTV